MRLPARPGSRRAGSSACAAVPSNAVIARQPPVICLLADALGGGEVDAGLGFVGQPDHGRSGAGLDDGAQGVGAGGEVGERPRLVAGGLRDRVDADPHPGDDPEHALGADEQLAQVRARRGLRGAAEVEHARRCHRAQAADHVVEPAVSRGVLTRRAGRREAADGGELEALREVAEREAALAEQSLGLRAGDAGAQFGLPGHLVERVQFVEAAQVQRHHGLEVAADRVEPADHAGAAAERDDRDAAVARRTAGSRPPRLRLPGSSTASGASWTPESLRRSRSRVDLPPARSSRPWSSTVTVRGADDRAQAVAIGSRQGRRPQPHLVGAGLLGAGPVDAERLAEQGADAVGQGFGRCRVAPGVPLHRGIDWVGIGACHELQYYR